MKKKLLLITTMKDLFKREMGEIQCNRQMCNYSSMDSSTRSSSFNGTGSNRKNSSYGNNEKDKLTETLDEHSTCLII